MELQAIYSNGGAYLVMENALLNKWPGATDMKVYDTIPFGADEGLISNVNGIPVVVLGMPDPLYAIAGSDNAILVTAVSCDNEDELPQLLQSVPDQWESIGTFTTQGPLTVFDSADAGSNVAEHHKLNLVAGKYDVQKQTAMGDDYEFQMLKFSLIR